MRIVANLSSDIGFSRLDCLRGRGRDFQGWGCNRINWTPIVLSVVIEFKNNEFCCMAYLEFLSDYQNVTNS